MGVSAREPLVERKIQINTPRVRHMTEQKSFVLFGEKRKRKKVDEK